MIDVKQLDENFTNEILKKLEIIADGAPRSIKEVKGANELHIVRSSDSNVGDDIYEKDLPYNFDIELSDGAKTNYAVKAFHAAKTPVSSSYSNGQEAQLIGHMTDGDVRGKEIIIYPELAIPQGLSDPEFKSFPACRIFVSWVEKINTSRLSQLCDNAIDLNRRIANKNPDYAQEFDRRNFDRPDISKVAFVDSSSNKIRTKLPSFDAPYLNIAEIQSTITDIGDMRMRSIIYLSFDGSNVVHIGNVSFYEPTNIDLLFKNATALQDIKSIDMRNVYSAEGTFEGCTSLKDGGIHLKNVPKKLDLSKIGCDASKYIVDNYIDDPVEKSILVLTDDNHSINSSVRVG